MVKQDQEKLIQCLDLVVVYNNSKNKKVFYLEHFNRYY